VLISVPKKRLHHAVDRNRAKRQVREAYRLQKQVLIEKIPEGKAIDIAFIWLSDRPCPTAEISHKVCSLLERIAKKIVY
jgi:ribonuclease P protein component